MKSPLRRLSYILTFTGSDTHSKSPKEPSDHLLSCYQSSIPNQHARKPSTTSTSSSDYSYDSDAKDAGSETSTRRVATPSKGGADRRRVAIMQMDSTTTTTTPSSLRSRRGHKSDLTGLALVAPPDAAPRTYTHLTPPHTAPLTAQYTPQTKKYPSHDQHAPNLDDKKDLSKTEDAKGNHRGSTHSRSQSPPLSTGLLATPRISNHPSNHPPMLSPLTPEIGQGKDIHIPVVGPVVVNLGFKSNNVPLSTSSRTNSPFPDASASLLGTPASSTASPFIHYQPGISIHRVLMALRLKPLQACIRPLVLCPLLREPIST